MNTIERVRELAGERGFSIYRLAKESGICYSTIHTAEKRNGQLSVDILERICAALDITLAEFFADEKERLLLQAGKRGVAGTEIDRRRKSVTRL